jgi:CO dehydrogenase maturation factor
MEHLSRRTTNNVDLLCIVAESTYAGVVTARRIAELVKKLPLNVKRTGLIWNKTDTPPELGGIELLGCVPNDDAVFNAAVNGQTIFELDENNPAYVAVGRIMENCTLKN